MNKEQIELIYAEVEKIDREIKKKVEQYGNAQKRYHGDNALSHRLEGEIDSLSIKKKLLLKGV